MVMYRGEYMVQLTLEYFNPGLQCIMYTLWSDEVLGLLHILNGSLGAMYHCEKI